MATRPLQQAAPVPIQVQFMSATTDAGDDSITQYSLSIVPSLQALMNGAGNGPTAFTVEFTLASNVQGAFINKIDQQSGTPPHFAHRSSNNKKKLTLTFDNKGLRAQQSFHYELQIMAPSVTITSTDPELMIPPPNG